MVETLHIAKRVRQRGITKEMIEITLEYGKLSGDKIKLGTRHIKELLRTKKGTNHSYLGSWIKVV